MSGAPAALAPTSYWPSAWVSLARPGNPLPLRGKESPRCAPCVERDKCLCWTQREGA